ncbi:lytic murein transglycosylase B [Paraburkholderia atlantica]|uniref:Membrane-bound lytic murein transglycosylase B n=1 Tax=Paraburkholderia atlantica TaxID=2654982 RepID=A0A7W8Q6T9_PARAM|nr:lytic murein transglycosylase B [Paraburkholderia atlantica]MBB5424858.1 membrane-bound lytic murein transglycosylase B [Paraburkholderia atlantica]NUY30438.1 lytic murein transglycosylase B [Paraburkholderia atlantica]
MFIAASPASAQSAPRKASVQLAQSQPQQPVPQGQTFEEEIIPQRYANNANVDAFINEMVARYDFDEASLHALFAGVSYSATAVKLVTPSLTPSVKNWRSYQARFLDPVRVNAGVQFWRENRATLQRAYQEFGVPPEMVVGIIGVETIYGRYMGNFRVLDALTTLSFDYPNTANRADRQATFRKNLEDYLVWTRDAQIDPNTVLGSYTGAIGIPQFLPSSIVQYAVDYEGNKHIDLRTSDADAIGSVANYLRQNGWESGRPVVWRIGSDAGSLGVAQAAATGQPEPHWPLDQLLRAGLVLNEPNLDIASEAGTPVTVVDLPTPGRGTEFVLGLKNFYVLTRYNRSFFYALAVYQLGQKVKAQMEAIDAANAAKAANNGGASRGQADQSNSDSQ